MKKKIKTKKYNWFEEVALKFTKEVIKNDNQFYLRYLINPIRMIFVFIGCIFLIRKINKNLF